MANVVSVNRKSIETRWPVNEYGAAHFVKGRRVTIITMGNVISTVVFHDDPANAKFLESVGVK